MRIIKRIDPRYEVNGEGIWVQRKFTSAMTPEVIDNTYPHDKIDETIRNDVGHYRGLHATFQTQRLFQHKYDICYSWGGGMPKLESYLKVDKIIVIDGMANKYNQHLEVYRKWYKYPGDVEFVELIFDSTTISQYPYDNNKSVIISFIHFLEHQTLKEHLSILEKLPKNKDILIYGPNISKYAGPSWVHTRPNVLDHNTFIPYEKMKNIILDFGYQIYFSTEFSDDLLFYFNTGE